MKLLVVDDDPDAADVLAFVIERAGYEVLTANDVRTARRLLAAERPALMLLDVNLGADNGFDFLAEVRRSSRLPVIMMTGLNAEADQVRGLDLGADDYVVKPYRNRELLARIRAVLRRHQLGAQDDPDETPGVLTAGPLVVNLNDRTVTYGGEPVNLALLEFRLLYYLMTRAGQVVSHDELMTHLWTEDKRTPENLRVLIHKLRQKLGDPAAAPRLLHTRFGHGIMLRPVDADAPPPARP